MNKDIIDATTTAICKMEIERLNKNIIDLATKNNNIKLENMHLGFKVYNQVFLPIGASVPKSSKIKINTLAFELIKEGEILVIEFNKFKRHETIIKQFLSKLLILCNTNAEYRNTLPECVVQLFTQIYINIEKNPLLNMAPKDDRFQREYIKTLPLIEYYCGLHLLY